MDAATFPAAHAVFRLRAELTARSRRPFLARGSRSERCPRCRVPPSHCFCALRPTPTTRAGFCLLMHGSEPMKSSNTGWLVADVVADTHAFTWSRTSPDPRLTALLADLEREPCVVFPLAATSSPERRRVVHDVKATTHKRPLFVLLDGTWAQARRMFRTSACLARFPVLALEPAPGRPARYRLRRATRDAELCTAEVAAHCLRLAGEPAAADALDAWLDVFVDTSMRLRGKA